MKNLKTKNLKTIAAVFIVLLTASANLNASQRVVVAEDFTATWCSYCPDAAKALDSLYRVAKDSLVVIAYHPSASDPFQTLPSVDRANYYNLEFYPTVFFSGGYTSSPSTVVGSFGAGTYDTFRVRFDSIKTISSPYEMGLSFISYDDQAKSGNLLIKIRNTSGVTQNGVLQFVALERGIPYAWQTMSEIDFLVRDMIPDANGEAVSIPAGDSIAIVKNFNIGQGWAFGNCMFAAFIQTDDHLIVQAAQSSIGPCLITENNVLSEATGNNNDFYEPGETGTIAVWVKSKWADVQGAKVSITSTDTFINITNGVFNIGTMSEGDTVNNQTTPFEFQVLPNADMPEGHLVTIKISNEVYYPNLNDTVIVYEDSVKFMVGTPVTTYTENFESGLGNWLAGSTVYTAGIDWDTTTAEYHSPNTCITNAKNINYANKQNRWIRMLNPLDLTGYSSAVLTWYEKYDVAAGDFCRPDVATDSAGAVWSTLVTGYNGSAGSWQARKVDITNYCNNKKYFRLRFRLSTDTVNVAKGWSVDDIAIDGYLKTGVEGEPVNNAPPVSIQLFNAYPNPSGKTSAISYQISSTQPVKLNIYDITGRLVKKLADEKQNPGRYQLIWDGTDNQGRRAATGVYFYSLQTAEGRQSKKLILVR
ncbi:T9SS type A sorting domain-containing protein [candidate division TA06 bacterium]|uniref:T9SS type A sorting domain-containing protein n=1 Tax=candidate division TA06 bacterium TaxID=2250710 RepID=A0A933MJH9_UNCT6|nr:T9SS type A sorting domain-containing protein [candidate division TA06 bacterium]